MNRRNGTSSDRIWAGFALSSVAFLVVLAISPVKDYLQEYRGFQNSYRHRLLENAGTVKEVRQARAMQVGIRQIWVPKFGNRVDRCTTCHLGTDNAEMVSAPEPFRLHPPTPHTPDDVPRFGCVVCHGGQGRATSLDEAHGNVPDWDRPLLPLRYTEASCGRCHLDDEVPEASLLSAGRALMRSSGCQACHEIRNHGDWKSDAPDLNGLSQKTSPGWLRAWLAAPRSLRPTTRMPNFHLSEEEVEALATFLWAQPPVASAHLEPEGSLPAGDATRGRTLFRESRCISCHTIEGRGQGSAPELSGIGSEVNRRWLVAYLGHPHAFQPRTRMPRYDFSRQDLLDLSQYLMDELYDPSAPPPGPPIRLVPKTLEAGERLYKMYGCAGCHRIIGKDFPAQVGPELTGIGDKPAALLDFGQRKDLPRRLPDWLAAKLTQPRSFRDGLKMPDFGFTPDQVESLVTALLSLNRDPVPASYRVESPPPSYAPPGRFGTLLDGYRCMSCHRIQGAGGDIARAPLTYEGSRAQKGWLEQYLLHPTTIRPILTERMIRLRMDGEEASFLADFIENVYVRNDIPETLSAQPPLGDHRERGRQLFFERFGCQSCHMVGGRGGTYGPMLDGVGERLKPGWIAWWLQGPQRWRSDVRCPNFAIDEADATDLATYLTSNPAAGSTTGGRP